MRSIDSLKERLKGLDGKDYAACQSLKGSYAYERFRLHVDRIPKDPYAPPGTGIFRVSVSRTDAGFPAEYSTSRIKSIAFRDFLNRCFHVACVRICRGRRGTGHSGLITIAEPGQEMLDRTSIHADEENIEARFFLGFPATGRRINAPVAQTMLFEELPRIVESTLLAENVDLGALEGHVKAAEDAEYLRGRLSEMGLVAFIADGAVLPRSSGIDPRPLQGESVVPFRSPDSMRLSIALPHAGTVSGMAVPEGVTLIVGGGYHGKSTVLQALELGIYDHIPADGRELCVCLPTAVKIRAYSGRSVTNTDISAFINGLPQQQDTTSFSTRNASGSTSQAAFVSEAVEAGARVLLMDEDTCAANFMIRDGRMQQLVASHQEPITAFVDRVKQLYRELGVSTVLVMGGSSDYFDVADCVIQMLDFQPVDVTGRVLDILRTSPSQRANEGGSGFMRPRERAPFAGELDSRNEYGHFRISARDAHHVVYGRMQIDLSDVEQIREIGQAQAIGRAIEHARKYMDGRSPVREVIDQVMSDVLRMGLDVLDPRCTGNLAFFRGLDLAAALNRIRGLTVSQGDGDPPGDSG